MRQFVVLGHDVPTDHEFPLDDLPGSAGRIDVLCRCVTSVLLVSHGVRSDSRCHLVFDDTLTITVDGGAVRRLNPDERSTAARLRNALERRDEAIGHQPVDVSPGITLKRQGVEATIDAVMRDATPVVLHEDGEPATEATVPSTPAFVLSDHHEFSEADHAALSEYDPQRISLGPVALHADQAITVAHNWLDTDGYRGG